MCGIIGFVAGQNIRINKLKKRVRDIYLQQRDRGYQGGGFYLQKFNGDKLLLRDKDPDVVLNELCYMIGNSKISSGDSVLFHHRYPTCTPNEEKYNHPLKSGKITLIHNGMLTDAYTIVKGYEDKIQTWEEEDKYGYKRYTDSEMLAVLIDEAIGAKKKLKPEHVLKAIEHFSSKVKGTLAIAFTHDNDPRIWLFRYSNPIMVYSDNHGNKFFSSEYPDTKNNHLGAFKDLYELKNGEYGWIDGGGFVSCGVVPNEVFNNLAMSKSSSYYDKHKGDYKWGKSKYTDDADSNYDIDDAIAEEETEIYNESYEDMRLNNNLKIDVSKMLKLYKNAPLFDRLSFTPYEEILRFKKEQALDNWGHLFHNQTYELMNDMKIKEFISAQIHEKSHPTKHGVVGEVVLGLCKLKDEGKIPEDSMGDILKVLRPAITRGFDDIAYENMFLFRLSNILKLKIQCFEMSIKNAIDDLDNTRDEFGQKLYEVLCEYENYYETEKREFQGNVIKTEEQIYGFSAEEYKKGLDKRISDFNQSKLSSLCKEEKEVQEFVDLKKETNIDVKAIKMLFTGTEEYNKNLSDNKGY